VTVSLSLNAAEPGNSGLGGKFTMLYYDAATKHVTAVVALEAAPLKLDMQHWESSDHNRGWGSVCTPGLPAALEASHKKWGSKPWTELVEPAAGRPADMVKAGADPTYAEMVAPAGLAEVARYADVIAPPTRAIIPLGTDGKLGAPTSLVADAHKAGLLVHVWTFRPENYFLAVDFRAGTDPAFRNEAGSIREIQAYLRAGIDGFFSDDPGLGKKAIAKL